MRNAIFKTLEVLINVLQNDDNIKTITVGTDSEIDLSKNSQFVLANINPIGVDFTNNNISYELTILAYRKTTKLAIIDKINVNDNRLDNLNLVHSIINTLDLSFNLRNDYDIELESISEPILFDKSFISGVDGMSVILKLSYLNNLIDPIE